MMKKDLKRHSSTSPKGRWILLIGVFVALFSIGLFALINKDWINPAALITYFSQLKTWLAEPKNHLQQKVSKGTSYATQKNVVEQPIHFKFYTTLPNMQVAVSDEIAGVTTYKKVPMPIVNANELEQEISKHIKENNYVIQLGIFHTISAAQKYSQTLNQIGFRPKVVKLVRAKKQVYRVQLGPYAMKSQAKMTQRQLQKRGVKSLIYTTYP